MDRRLLVIATLVALLPSYSFASKKKTPPKAPLPPAIASAHSVFITNAGGNGSSLAFDEFYADMKSWGRFKLASSPSEADLVVELKYVIEDKGQHTGTSYNSYTKQTSVYSYDVTDPQLVLNIYDAKSNGLLWATTDHRRLARLEKNREKKQSIQRIG